MLFKYEFMYFQETFFRFKYLFSRTNDEKRDTNKPPGCGPAINCLKYNAAQKSLKLMVKPIDLHRILECW